MKRVQCIRLIQEIFIAAVFVFSTPCTLLADQDHSGDTSRPIPQRVISLGQTITERIYLLGAGDRLVANTIYCVEPEDAKYKEKIGTLLQANLEKIISLKPDLVIASNLARQKQLTKLKALGIRVVQFSYPKSFEQMCRQFIELGEILGQRKTAEEVVQNARKRVAAIRMKLEDLPKKTVFMQLGIKPLHAVTNKSFLNDYIEFGGGINVALNEGRGTYSREKVLSVNPEVIIVATMGSSEGEAGKREKERWMTYPSIAAVKNQNVYVVDPDKLCSPTPVTFVEALREIAGLIHPDLGHGDVK
ncbi:MAG: ABC transporter substrate-binding protein [Deltaproteobacteria bacterium]|nr:ABC transporter substrate-binding protein [Deltaproteobacteria bacterium]